MQPFLTPQHYSHRALALWGGSMLAAAAVLSLLVAVGDGTPVFQPIDQAWYQFMRAQRADIWLSINQILNWLGYAGIVIYQVLILLLLLRHQQWGGLFTVLAALSVVVLTQSLKHLLDRPRPENQIIEVGTPAFPSGHTTATVAAVVATGFIVGRLWVWITGICIFILMMLSRTYLGVHWLSDTVAGWLIGAGAVTLLWIYFQEKCIPEYIHEEKREQESGEGPVPLPDEPIPDRTPDGHKASKNLLLTVDVAAGAILLLLGLLVESLSFLLYVGLAVILFGAAIYLFSQRPPRRAKESTSRHERE